MGWLFFYLETGRHSFISTWNVLQARNASDQNPLTSARSNFSFIRYLYKLTSIFRGVLALVMTIFKVNMVSSVWRDSKVDFRAFFLRRSEGPGWIHSDEELTLSTSIHFLISLLWSIHVVNPVYKTELSKYSPPTHAVDLRAFSSHLLLFKHSHFQKIGNKLKVPYTRLSGFGDQR